MSFYVSAKDAGRASAQLTPGYMSGFVNSFETEALPGVLPIGRNAPQHCARLVSRDDYRVGFEVHGTITPCD